MNDRLKQSLAEVLNVAPDALNRNTVLEELDAWDSVAILSIMVVLDEGLGCEIAPEKVIGFKTFGDIEDLVTAKAA